jgi:GAF domain-containing protein
MMSADMLADLFVKVADTLVDEFDLVDFLHDLVGHVAELSDVPAVGLMLTDARGELRHLVGSTQDVEALEVTQLTVQEGPCLDCFRTGQRVTHGDLRSAAERWPRFAGYAVEVGFLAVSTFPMRLRDDVIGALNLFGRSTGPLADDVRNVVQALADVATIAILQERAVTRADVLASQLEFAFNSRVVVEQAKGAIARTLNISVDEAFERLRRHARDQRAPLTEVAREVLADREAIRRLPE